ncbi:FadR/GntR family transcriptional regulator [Neomoorella thermoacetica]|uniref:Transcriptional regulators n=2 Tax=Neomoorella thermoacetica TaxID=1525 RepID=A0A0S6UCL0_NEOTH|nr:FadR/GntR family transcriptional regulator [Moorella thermoacetica]AKX95158.1 HTH-type transcriptional regulator LutR [Moorella thermoacetica]AKX97783.1 HTH-type transcriptional regulator LutR [Moorella thermoacetica]APC09507.1 HTH-type transcriptional regulator LutR [Moorella thermoacetica]OIQ52892.1 HTH-type transcriptional regulator LutR [Moorella thermoacetica]OIQ56614.1 HTH-type transcriptional regulator LutR [Moorella thermoacetica]
MDLRPIRTKKIYEEIVQQIKDLIGEGNLKPGDRLPSERELSERLAVSRASVREALSALAAMGVIVIRPGEGTFVQNIRNGAIVEPLAMALLLDRQAAMELLEARQALEGEAAYLAARRAGPEDLEKMEELLKEMEHDLQRGILGEEADLRFHLAIAEAARNSVLARLMHTVSDTMRQALKTSRQRLYTTAGNPEKLFAQHNQIYEAIKAHDPRAARKAICQHLRFVEKELQKE